MIKVRSLLKILKRKYKKSDTGWVVKDLEIINAFISDKENTFLVSFPRTGSHWLRMIMELYFERPSLTRVFYYPEKKNYLSLHTHDLELDVTCSKVVYLYREPVSTIYSQLKYHKEDVSDLGRIAFWTELYGRHLDKWLHVEMFTKQKTVLCYEKLSCDLPGEFSKLTAHFDHPFDPERLEIIANKVSKNEVKKKTKHDLQVVDLNSQYLDTKRKFTERYGEYVWKILLKKRAHLKGDFSYTGPYSF